jgi:hypothetical protein
MVLALDDDVRRNRPALGINALGINALGINALGINALGINALNHRSPFSIARLGQFRSAFSIRACNDHRCGDLTHYKAGFVKIVNIGIGDSVFCDRLVARWVDVPDIIAGNATKELLSSS